MRQILVILSVLLFFAVQTAAGPLSAIPEQVRSVNPRHETPLWVTARAAIDQTGKLRPGVLTQSEVARLHLSKDSALRRAGRGIEAAATDTCVVTFTDPQDLSPFMGVSTTWGDVVDQAKAGIVFSGHVVVSDVGLFHGIPFALLAIDVVRSSQLPQPQRVYLLHPSARVSIEGSTWCTTDSNYRPIPQIGDRIVFVARQALDDEGVVFRVPPERIFVEHIGSLVVPRRRYTDAETAPFENLTTIETRLLSAALGHQ